MATEYPLPSLQRWTGRKCTMRSNRALSIILGIRGGVRLGCPCLVRVLRVRECECVMLMLMMAIMGL
jgi:hypothetical protein